MLKAVLDRETLGEVLSRASKLVSRLSKGAFLHPGVLLVVEGESLMVYATDMDNWVIQRMPIYEGEDGRAYVPVKEMLNVLKGADGGSVVLEREDTVLTVKIGEDALYRINLYNEEEFPALPEVGVEEGLMVDMEEILNGVEKVGWCASKDDPRPFLTGIYLHTKDGELRFVASDGSVLGFYARPDFSGEIDIILPAYVQGILKTLPKSKGIVSVKDKVLHVSVDDDPVSVLAVVRGIDDDYVDYEGIVPKDFVAEVVVETDVLRRKIDRMMAMAPDTYEVDVEVTDGEITLRTVSPKGEGVERLKAETTGEIKVRLIGSHVTRMLKYIDSSSVKISFSGDSTPVKVGPTTDERHFYLTLPIA